jgi:hypothetical protein
MVDTVPVPERQIDLEKLIVEALPQFGQGASRE